jgi:Domain of unknown function (DUF4159)
MFLVLLGWFLLAAFSTAQEGQSSNELVDEYIEKNTKETYELNQSNEPQARAGRSRMNRSLQVILADFRLQFIRLEHGGLGWNDGMDKSCADENFLKEFAKISGLKVAEKGESISIDRLAKYPANDQPLFVYITGSAAIGNISEDQIKILREYCLRGGTLIADAGSVTFHESFLQLMPRIFPEKKLVDIAKDDTIYVLPYTLNSGSPTVRNHGGDRTLGIKHEEHWCVFYQPGDLNDAWKSKDFTEATPEIRQMAMDFGFNLIYYALLQKREVINKDTAEQKQNIDNHVPQGQKAKPLLGKP